MFDIGFTEILLIGVISLIVIGPEKLPATIRTGLRYFRQLKSGVASIRDEVERELSIDELRKEVASGKEKISQSIGYNDLNKSLNELNQETRHFRGDFGGWDDDDDGEVSDAEIEADLAVLAGEVGPQLPLGDSESDTGVESEKLKATTVAKTNQSKSSDIDNSTSENSTIPQDKKPS